MWLFSSNAVLRRFAAASLRFARAEKPILFSCSSSPIIMQILPFSTTPIHNRGPKLGFTGRRKGVEGKGDSNP